MLQATRKRALSVAGGCLGVLLLFLIAIPLPFFTSAEGVVWLPDDLRVKTETHGEVSRVLVKNGDHVVKGQALVQLTNASLIAELAFNQASLREYDARLQQAWLDDRAQAQLLEQDVSTIKADVEHLQTRVNQLTIRSPNTGYFRALKNYQLVGSYLAQGDSLALIETPEPLRIRAAILQEEIGLVRKATQGVEVRLASNPSQLLPALVSQQVPAATFDLPNIILGAKGGGRIAVDATKIEGTKTAQLIFLVDVSVSDNNPHTPPQAVSRFGERAYVRFYHPAEPLGFQLYRLMQQLLIRTFQQ